MSLKETEPVRLYLYPVAVAVLGVLVYYGVIESDSVPLWTAVVVAVLSVGGIEKARTKVTPYQGDHEAD